MPGYVKPPVNGRINGTMEMIPSLSTQTPLTIKGAVSQSANLLNIQDSSGTVIGSIDSSGRHVRNNPSFLIYSTTGTAYHGGSAWTDISRFLTSGGVSTAVVNHNIGSNWNASTGRFTAPVSGRYLFYAGGWTNYSGAGNRYAICFNINGGSDTFISGANTSAVDSPVAMSPIIHNLVANDYMTCRMYSSVAMNLGTGSHVFYYGGYLIG
jgi:hypothetical protein